MRRHAAAVLTALLAVSLAAACGKKKPPDTPHPPPPVATPTPAPPEPPPPPEPGPPAVCAPNNIEHDGGFGCPKEGWRCPAKGEKGASTDYVRDPEHANRCVPVAPPPPPPGPRPTPPPQLCPDGSPPPCETEPPPPPPPPPPGIPPWSRCNRDFRNDALCHHVSDTKGEHWEGKCGSAEHLEHIGHGDGPTYGPERDPLCRRH